MTDWIVVDLGFGDAGKGSVVDHLVRERGADLVVRFNGGAQAGHSVVTPEGRRHCFSQFCAGTLAGAHGLLGPDFLLHPGGMLVEGERLEREFGFDPWARTWVAAEARVITPYQQAANRILEDLRGDARHGSCGLGIGQCAGDTERVPEDAIRARLLGDRDALRERLESQRERKRDEMLAAGADPTDLGFFDDSGVIERILDTWARARARLRLVEDGGRELVRRASRVVYEGAQGVLLDQALGFFPHVTYSDCTPRGARALAGDRPAFTLGLTRAYSTRHGAGPFPTEDRSWHLPEPHSDDTHAGPFRVGALDTVLLRHALASVPVDALGVTCLDRVERPPVCDAYEEAFAIPAPGDRSRQEETCAWLATVTPKIRRVDDVVAHLEDVTGLSVALRSRGPRSGEKVSALG